jgi:hypothetical protein
MSAIEVEAIVAGVSDPKQAHEVLIDGQRLGTVHGGETRLFAVSPGIHTVRLMMNGYSPPPVKVVVGFGKTSLVCQTTARKLFGVFPVAAPTTQILVREDYDPAPEPVSHILWGKPRDDAPIRLAAALAD